MEDVNGQVTAFLLDNAPNYPSLQTISGFCGDLGEKSSKLIDYFMRLPNTRPMVEGYNPATWMLEVIGAGVEAKAAKTTDYVQAFKDSEEYKLLQAGMDIYTVPRPDAPEMKYKTLCAAAHSTQFKCLLQRFMRMYWRTPSYNNTRIALAAVLAVLFGITYLSVDYTNYSDVTGGICMVSMTTLFVGIISFNSVLPLASEERSSYYREHALQTYMATWYWIASTVVEIPYVVISTFVFTIIYYPFVGFTGDVVDVIIYGFELSLHVLMNVYFGMLMVFMTPRVDVAASLGALLNSIFFLFMGFNPPASQIPSGYKWLITITPPKYSLSALVGQVFAKCDGGKELGCKMMTEVPPIVLKALSKTNVTVKEFTEYLFDMKSGNIVRDTIGTAGIIVLFRFLGLLAMRFLNFQMR
ncbi:hypothetical protein AC1031_011427 [Aphanomyces cochlioides]|nr:hypothetical protein AC1031_011427 [Aphanomyces cochlioides]